jgi:hypothetical protein
MLLPQRAVAERVGHRQRVLGLPLIVHQRHFLVVLDVVNLERYVMPPAASRKTESASPSWWSCGEGAGTGFGETQLEAANVVGGRRIG